MVAEEPQEDKFRYYCKIYALPNKNQINLNKLKQNKKNKKIIKIK